LLVEVLAREREQVAEIALPNQASRRVAYGWVVGAQAWDRDRYRALLVRNGLPKVGEIAANVTGCPLPYGLINTPPGHPTAAAGFLGFFEESRRPPNDGPPDGLPERLNASIAATGIERTRILSGLMQPR
jgi:hypothetical protein